MTEATEVGLPGFDISGAPAAARRRRRYAAERRLRLYGLAAITLAIGLLATLLTTIVINGRTAFVQTHITVDFPISPENVDPADPANGNWRAVVSDGIQALLPGAESPAQVRAMSQILTNNTQFFVRNAVLADPSVIGGTLTLAVPAGDYLVTAGSVEGLMGTPEPVVVSVIAGITIELPISYDTGIR